MDFFFFFSDKLGTLPEIESVKKCVKQVALLGDRVGAPLSDSDDKLADEIQNLAYTMFCYHKHKKKNFTVCGNAKLKRMRIAEDADGFSDEDSLFLLNVLRNNLEAFAELIAQSYLPQQSKEAPAPQQLFFAEVYSHYSSNVQPVFFANKDGEFFVFKDTLTNIKLVDYITDYFSITTESEIQSLAATVLVPGKAYASMQKIVIDTFNKFNISVQTKYNFVSGAITFLDFLGWKGLWQSQNGHNPLKDVSSLIDDFRQKLNKLSQDLFIQAKEMPLSSLISISDTIAIFTPKVSVVDVCQLLELHAKLSKYIIERCVQKKYPIRGAIAFGKYSIMNNIMIGPGIDECASWHETGSWIGVHFTPTAQIYWNSCINPISDIICDYRVPLKNGLSVDYCVKWNVAKETFNEMALNTKALLPEIAGKYTNTYKFLKEKVWGEGDANGKK